VDDDGLYENIRKMPVPSCTKNIEVRADPQT
jgi:hypothetical protein